MRNGNCVCALDAPIKRKACGSSIPIHAIVPYRIIYTTLEKRFVWNDMFIMMRIIHDPISYAKTHMKI